ncbi:MAG: imidazolonepropionase [Proteobacteria bacterium]|nr:imidazolonepropionase [Pseudomonadota bacterium]
MWDELWVDIRAATVTPGGDGFGLVESAALAVHDGRIAWIGPAPALPGPAATLARRVHSGGGRLATPGLVDCHTHLVFGGDRALDADLRAQGASYASIAAAGGGIRSTVRHTRDLSAAELAEAALPRARRLLADGVTTLEVKSGYGLDVEGELKLLEAARLVGERLDVEVVPTLLALHALPPEFAADRAGYVDRVVRELIPEVARARLAVAVDVFCETIAFTPAECARALGAAREHGLAVKVHADQLSDGGGAALAAKFGALSADHLEYTGAPGVAALAASGTVAVLLPGAFLLLNESQRPPVAALRAAGVPLAVATDLNPGTSPCTSLTVALALARAQFGLGAAEGLAAVTREAGRALGLGASRGTLEAGKRADFCLWDLAHPRELGYWLGPGACHTVVRGGRARPAAAA